MYYYTAFCFGISSELPLPWLKNGKIKNDIYIRLGKVDSPPYEETNRKNNKFFINGTLLISRDNIGKCLVKNGSEIIIDEKTAIGSKEFQHFIFQHALAALLYQRGFFLLHASAVVIKNKAVVFMGNSGSGKSTIAAAFYNNSYDIISDDLTALELCKDQHDIFVRPQFSSMNLYKESVSNLNNIKKYLSPSFSFSSGKYAYVPDRTNNNKIFPVECVYLLGRSEYFEITTLTKKEGLLQLLDHIHPVSKWFLNNYHERNLRFQQYIELSMQLCVREFKRPYDLERLLDAVSFLEEEIH